MVNKQTLDTKINDLWKRYMAGDIVEFASDNSRSFPKGDYSDSESWWSVFCFSLILFDPISVSSYLIQSFSSIFRFMERFVSDFIASRALMAANLSVDVTIDIDISHF